MPCTQYIYLLFSLLCIISLTLTVNHRDMINIINDIIIFRHLFMQVLVNHPYYLMATNGGCG